MNWLKRLLKRFCKHRDERRPSGHCRSCGDHTLYRSVANPGEWCCHHCSY